MCATAWLPPRDTIPALTPSERPPRASFPAAAHPRTVASNRKPVCPGTQNLPVRVVRVREERVSPSAAGPEQTAQNYNWLPSCAGLQKTTCNTQALHLIKNDIFYILPLHNRSCSSRKHQPCCYLHLFSSSLCFCTHDGVEHVSDV